MRITIVGSGNVAEALAEGLTQAGHRIVEVVARNKVRGEAVAAKAASRYSERPSEKTDIFLIAVSDKAVKEVAATLPEGAIVAHTAGSVGMEALEPHTERGVFYPFMTFSIGRKVDWSVVPILLEASDPKTLATLMALAESLSQRVAMADGKKRGAIHLAGVFASNFVNAMYGAATEILRNAGLDASLAAPLLLESAAKAATSSDPASVQTGPAVRGDKATMERHRLQLENRPDLKEIYDKTSDYIWQTKISKNS